MVETSGSNAQHQVNREDDQQGEDGNFMPPVTLTSEQWQQLMSSRDGDSRSLRDRDGEKVIYHDMGKNIPSLSKSALHLERTQWLTDVEDLSRSNGSGIRMRLIREYVTCSLEHLDFAVAQNRERREFTVNMVVPFSEIFAVKDKDSAVLRLPDTGGTMCQLPIPTRIFDLLSSQVYSLLMIKIPNEQRAQFSTVARQDGLGLVRKLRTVMDCVAATPLQILERRKDSLKLESLGGWLEYREKFMKLVQDWSDHIARDLIPPDEIFTIFRQKKKLKECSHILDGLSRWMGSSDHKMCRIEEIIEECEILQQHSPKN
jgi:hypothetical protein